jgi:hypothetical protein
MMCRLPADRPVLVTGVIALSAWIGPLREEPPRAARR